MYFETEGTVFEQFKDLASDLNSKKGDIAIYGFGTSAHRAIPVLLSKGFHIIAILDQNPTLKGNVFMGIPVILPEDTINFDIPLVVTVEFLMWSLIKKLTKKGFHNVIPYYFL
jgi:FlaA1/EpsC-like NDP-sugar epimerase